MTRTHLDCKRTPRRTGDDFFRNVKQAARRFKLCGSEIWQPHALVVFHELIAVAVAEGISRHPPEPISADTNPHHPGLTGSSRRFSVGGNIGGRRLTMRGVLTPLPETCATGFGSAVDQGFSRSHSSTVSDPYRMRHDHPPVRFQTTLPDKDRTHSFSENGSASKRPRNAAASSAVRKQ